MANATLHVTPRAGVTALRATSSDAAALRAAPPVPLPGAGGTTFAVPLVPLRRGRARVSVALSDGSEAVAHFAVLPPLPAQVAAVATHWAEVAWLPKDFPDPFGRGASVMPWDREAKRHRLQDGRAYDVGLSDDAGAASNLGLASAQMWAPTSAGVGRLDEYVAHTLYGVKPETAAHPLKSLQLAEPNDGVRMTMFYYNQSHFAYNYTEAAECGVVGGLNFNWCSNAELGLDPQPSRPPG